jgi:hypothetical protein
VKAPPDQPVEEPVIIPVEEWKALREFQGQTHLAVSAYLNLDSAVQRQAAYEEFMRQMQIRLDECGARQDCREAAEEDIEIVRLYLKTNGERRFRGVAIFSCAPEYFWRAYPLPVPVPTQVTVGRHLDLEPLEQTMAALELSSQPA